MLTDLEILKTAALSAIETATDAGALAQARVEFLGKKSQLTCFGGRMREVPPDQKGAAGSKLNEVRTAITAALEAKEQALFAAKDAAAVASIDVTLPGRPAWPGGLHPLTSCGPRGADSAAWASRSPTGRTSRPSGIASTR